MTQRKQTILDTIVPLGTPLLQNAKHLLEKELQYDSQHGCSVTDDIEKIIEALEFDLGEEE